MASMPSYAILKQQADDGTEVLGYFSKILTNTERKYSIYDLELLSTYGTVKYSVCKLLDKTFTIQTDSQSLARSFKKHLKSALINKFANSHIFGNFTAPFNMCNVIPDAKSQIADCLSRKRVYTNCRSHI